MYTRLGRFIFVVVLPLFVLIAGVLLQESQARPDKSSCLRRCHRLAERTAGSKVLLLCHELCKATQAADQRGLIAHDIIKHRIRKALKAIPECLVSSPNQTVDWTPSENEVNVTFGLYKNSSHWYANISWTPLNETYGNWTGIVVKFAVENVRPLGKRLYPSICTQHPKNQTFLQVNLSSYEYHFPDAILLKILAFPYSPKEELTDALQFKPPVPTSPTLAEGTTAGSLPTASTKPPKFSPKKAMQYVSSSVGVVAGVFAVILAGFFYKRFTRNCLQHRRSRYDHSSDDPGPENYDYDVFIMFNGCDSKWVEEKLLPLLEGEYRLRCRVHYRDFRAGGSFYDQMSDSIHKSYKNVVVYSMKFLNSCFCAYELNQAKQRLLSRNDDSLVIIRIDGADLGLLPEGLRGRSVIDYGSNRERPHWKRKLLVFLGVPHKYCHLTSTKNNNTQVSLLEPVNGDVMEN